MRSPVLLEGESYESSSGSPRCARHGGHADIGCGCRSCLMKQRMAIDMKLYPQKTFVLTPLQAGPQDLTRARSATTG